MLYSDFRHRYIILAPVQMTQEEDGKLAAEACMEHIGMEEEKYRLGRSKIFFRSGSTAFIYP